MTVKNTWSATNVRVRVDRSFGSMYRGEQFETQLDAQTEGWIRAGLLIVTGSATAGVDSGESETGPGEPATDVQRSEPA